MQEEPWQNPLRPHLEILIRDLRVPSTLRPAATYGPKDLVDNARLPINRAGGHTPNQTSGIDWDCIGCPAE